MKRKIPETINEEELHKLCKTIKDKNRRLAYLLGFYQCMRISEVTKLKIDNVDKRQKIIRIKQGKGGKDRNIPIAPEVERGLKHLPIKVKIRALQVSFKKSSREVLDKDLHFHCLRHSGATHYLNVKKWNLRQLQIFLGHSDLSTTQIYTHVSPKELMDVMWN